LEKNKKDERSMKTWTLFAMVFLSPAPHFAAELARAGAGGTVTGGNHDFSGVSIYGDADFLGAAARPYVWADFTTNSFVRQLSLGGGAWKELNRRMSVKGGLGLAFGRDKDSGDSLSSFSGEVGVQRDLRDLRIGAEYRLTRGTLSGSRYSRAANEDLSLRKPRRSRGTADPEIDAFTTHEISGLAGGPLSRGWLHGRLSLVKPSGQDTLVNETLGFSWPMSEVLALNSALTFEQGPMDRVYLSVGAYWNFEFSKKRRKR
jgi:hypothetical protein